MREILFRGKRVDNDAWVEGLLIIIWGQYHIIQPNDENTAYPIIFKTVGQYTGMVDKNGTKIFEGDIVEFTDSDGDTTLYEVFWDGNNGKFAIAASGNRNYVDDFELFERNEYFKLFEVIGNIFENPGWVGDENNV